jgi:hypothetical protein
VSAAEDFCNQLIPVASERHDSVDQQFDCVDAVAGSRVEVFQIGFSGQKNMVHAANSLHRIMQTNRDTGTQSGLDYCRLSACMQPPDVNMDFLFHVLRLTTASCIL